MANTAIEGHTGADSVQPGVAALFVRKSSHYKALGVDCFDEQRNALTFEGGKPGIYHPPCRSWGQLAHMSKPRPGERELAVWSMDMVRRFGGVLEHPFASKLWAESGCLSDGIRDQFGGVLVPVYQSWWGHRAPKRSRFYVVGPLIDMPFVDQLPAGRIEKMCRAERERTPFDLAVWLVRLAQGCAK